LIALIASSSVISNRGRDLEPASTVTEVQERRSLILLWMLHQSAINFEIWVMRFNPKAELWGVPEPPLAAGQVDVMSSQDGIDRPLGSKARIGVEESRRDMVHRR